MDHLNQKIALPFGTYGDFEKKYSMVRTGGLKPPRGYPRQILSTGPNPLPH